MKPFLLIDYVPWVGSVIAEIFVVVIMLKRDLVRRFPLFFVSLGADLLREAVLAAVLYKSLTAYSYTFWSTLPIEYVIAFAVMLEAFRHSLGASPKIPPQTLRLLAVLT